MLKSKIEKDIQNAIDFGKLPKNLSLYDFKEVLNAYESLLNTKIYNTINSSVANYFKDKHVKINCNNITYTIKA